MEITWKILNLKRQSSDDLVTIITYECNVSKDKFSNRKIDNISIVGDVSSPDFVPFDDLTEELVLVWLNTELGEKKATIEADLESKIDAGIAKRAARLFKRGTPWSN